jgi:hypothetical protein
MSIIGVGRIFDDSDWREKAAIESNLLQAELTFHE